ALVAAVVVVDQDVPGGFDGAGDDVPGVGGQAGPGGVDVDVGHAAGGQEDDVVAGTVEFAGFDAVVQPDVDAEALAFIQAPVDDPDQVSAPRGQRGQRYLSSHTGIGFEHGDVVAALGQRPSGLQAGGSAPDHRTAFG